MPEEKKCSSCGNILKPGFFYVRNNDNPVFFNHVVWVEGEKQNIADYMGSNASTPQYPVTPHKCEICGHIEFFVDPVEKWRP